MPIEGDKDWAKWCKIYGDVYRSTQRNSILTSKVNDAGYEILNDIDFTGLSVAEIGPGGGYHLNKFSTKPKNYFAIDVASEFLVDLQKKVEVLGTNFTPVKVEPYNPTIPLQDVSQDVIITFYSLEHLHPLEQWLDEILRILKPGGLLIGAIPAEGGLAWGIGRFLTSRRTVKRDYGWEHPNFSDEIINLLRKKTLEVKTQKWPIPFAPIDFSFVVKFIFKKASV
jgi:SAM-dependent methyltransferase